MYTAHDRITMLSRMIPAAGRAVALEDVETLVALVALQDVLADAIAVAVSGLRRDHTWRTIGAALDVTPQACVIRWGDRARATGNIGPRATPRARD